MRIEVRSPLAYLRNFLTWWKAELATIYPRRFSPLRRGTFAVAYFDAKSLNIIAEINGRVETLYLVDDMPNDGSAYSKIDNPANILQRSGLKLVLRLSPKSLKSK